MTIGWKQPLTLLLALSFMLSGCTEERKNASSTASVQSSTTAHRADSESERQRLVPPAKGGSSPLTVVTFFEDFSCPACRRSGALAERLLEAFGDDVQVQYRTLDRAQLSGRGASYLTTVPSRAAVAAGLQGKFWEMHDAIYATQSLWSRTHLKATITKLSWDGAGKGTATVDRGRPQCVNGVCKHDNTTNCEAPHTLACTDFGLRGGDVGKVGALISARVSSAGDDSSVVSLFPSRSAKDATEETLHRTVHVGSEIDFVRLGSDGAAFRERFVALAKSLGLDEEEFRKDLGVTDQGNPRITVRLCQDQALGNRLTVTATPTVFVNGRRAERRMDGRAVTQTLYLVREELHRGEKLMSQGVAREDVAWELTKSNLFDSATMADRVIRDKPDLSARCGQYTPKALEFGKQASLNYATSPRIGPAGATMKLAVFSDFECPYCSKIAPVLEQLVEASGGQVAVYFKHFPLSFHKRARPSAIASVCAQEQGKFWEFHDAMFAQSAKRGTYLKDDALKQYAVLVGLDASKFAACLTGTAAAARVDADMAEAKTAGVRGTPNLFLNGYRYSGADRTPRGLLNAFKQLPKP